MAPPPPLPPVPAPSPPPPPPPPPPAAPPYQPPGADWTSLAVQPWEREIGHWIMGLLGGGSVSGVLVVTDRRLLFKPKVGGTTIVGMLVSQLPTYKDRHTIVLAREQIATIRSEKGIVNTKIWITAVDGTTYGLNRGVQSADPILEALRQGGFPLVQ